MEKIKIAVFLHGLSGGAGQVVIDYFSHMKYREDYDIDVITLNVESDKLRRRYESAGMRVLLIPSKKESILKNLLSMYHIFRRKKYDIAYGHMTLTNCFPFCIAKLCGIRTRISHSHLVVSPTIFNRVLAKATQLFSTDYLACGIEAGKSLYGDHPFEVFNNAIDLQKFKYNSYIRYKIRKNNDITDDNFVIGHIGRFDKQKNHDQLIDIFKVIVSENKDAKLILIGDGILLSKIKEKVKNYGIEKNVIFTGAIDNVAEYIQAMDVFVLPSLYEGLCLSAIEAQCSGVPCVFSDTVSIETKKIENVYFVGLNDSSEKWAREILSMENTMREKKSIQILKEYGYDINIEAQRLDVYLRNSLTGK
ncbi:hypothetical protein FC48_GL001422 [Ligilactobacillus murinus DSM 20452 = NBRC 14221]|uniref:Glycosyl transferase family 1 domain-containing protein n=1 Tax=Ligilactobacillus murinus DSM 20452 = NBRC 14221 TaxID=1423772 RepID=A0A0R2BGN8_9LACO|nr:glycosyltransferase [Ligilactobacillus murinus]KRM76724.1 hypothetical protein FC48_GL001422 [Ligilactobacillus murinus DSM 20452 = NBRC 14221]